MKNKNIVLLEKLTGKKVVLIEAKVSDKDWSRMSELVLSGKDGEGIASTITNKDKAIARYVAGNKLGGNFNAFKRKALELGATQDEIQSTLDSATIPQQYLDKLQNNSGKKLDSSYAGPISKLVLALGLDIKFLPTNGYALTRQGKDAMSRNGRNWTMGYKTEITLKDGTVMPFDFDAITDEGFTRPTLYVTSRLGNIGGGYDQPVGVREYLARIKKELDKLNTSVTV